MTALNRKPTAAENAIFYLLDRQQKDPDLRAAIGPGTAAFARLCLAEAEIFGVACADIVEERTRDLRPAACQGPSEIEILRRRVANLRAILEH